MVAVTGRACKEAAGGGAGAGEAAKIPWRTGAMLWSISRLQTAYRLTMRLRQAGDGLEAKQKEEETSRAKLEEGSGDA